MWVHADYYYKALQFIRLNYPDPELSVARIADHMGISRSHLYRIFDSVSHQSIQDCILSFRLKKAAALLKNSAAAIGEIAQSCGFSNQSHFTSIFKQYYGETPSSYRKDK
ncbi:helix-turn-helix transcriptional regulator [Lachnoclostridium sp. An76]|nr:helix-turn-helix transcriptional regulator [Lachnoclostridium sp. An76]